MELGRSPLTEIDRNILSGLNHDEGYRMVRLPN